MEMKQKQYRRVLYGIANKLGLRSNELFAQFMINRFPGEKHESYIAEWVTRFMSGNPTNYMDNESYLIYMRLLSKGKEKIAIEAITYPLKDVNEIVEESTPREVK